MVPQAVLNEMWRAGYCEQAIRAAAKTAPEDVAARIAYLKEHVPSCKDCYNAAVLKELEHDVAEKMGLLDLFSSGGDVSKQPGFHAVFDPMMADYMRRGRVDLSFFLWMGAVLQRGPCPVTVDAETTPDGDG